MRNSTRRHTKHTATKTLESACPKFIDEFYPNLNTYDIGLSGVIAHALRALGEPYVEHHLYGDIEFVYDEEEGVIVNYEQPKNKVNPKYIAIQEIAIFERRLTERRKKSS